MPPTSCDRIVFPVWACRHRQGPRGAGRRSPHLQSQQLRHGLWVLLLAALGTTEVDIAGLGRHSVPDQLIRRLLVEKQVSRRVPHSYRIVLRFFPLRGDSVLGTILIILFMINVRVFNLYAYINVPFVPGGINSLGTVA